MALCLVALPVLAILGIFSIRYRKLAKDSLQCLFKTVTLRKCETGLDERIKSGITGNLLKYSPGTAKFVYRHYKLLSWIFIILLIWSAYEGSIGVYNYVQYGNCNGPESTNFCILDPTGEYTGTSELNIDLLNIPTQPAVKLEDPIIGDPNAPVTIIEFGCYVCEYTRKAEPTIQKVLQEYEGKVNIQYKAVEIPHHENSLTTAMSGVCAQEQGKYTEFHEEIFKTEELDEVGMKKIAEKIGLNVTDFINCYSSQKYKQEIEENTMEGVKSGIQGTPTFFINDKMISGPKPFKTFKNLIEEALA